jgi:hypothetical protein
VNEGWLLRTGQKIGKHENERMPRNVGTSNHISHCHGNDAEEWAAAFTNLHGTTDKMIPNLRQITCTKNERSEKEKMKKLG